MWQTGLLWRAKPPFVCTQIAVFFIAVDLCLTTQNNSPATDDSLCIKKKNCELSSEINKINPSKASQCGHLETSVNGTHTASCCS